MGKSLPSGTDFSSMEAAGLKLSRRTAAVQHCERPGGHNGDGSALVAVHITGLKGHEVNARLSTSRGPFIMMQPRFY